MEKKPETKEAPTDVMKDVPMVSCEPAVSKEPTPRPIKIMETAFRDAHQSIMATRLRIEDMIPVAEKMDEVGYESMEIWGGATFDTCMRFLDEDPWERLRELRKRFKKTKLQMLLRGQNLVGYRHYGDDAVREFVKRAIGNGLDIVRVFDALNDLRNMEIAADQVKREGAHLQMALSYTISPVHTLEKFADIAHQMQDMGADSICIKDMAGLISPVDASSLVKTIKARTGLPIQVHSHYTSGMAAMAYLAAIEAGADIIDCAISPFAMGTSQPATETMIAALRGGPYDTGMTLESLLPAALHFKEVKEKYSSLVMGIEGVDINVLIYQIPGGMYSNLVSQLKDQKALHRLEEVLKEIPRVRKEMGYPPLVTPTSQLVGSQATLNVLMGRWKVVPKEIRQYLLGYYGRPPAPVDPEIQKQVIGDEIPITCRPGEVLPPEVEDAEKAIAPWILQPEDVLSYVLFPAVARDFLVRKFARTMKRDVGLDKPVEDGVYPI